MLLVSQVKMSSDTSFLSNTETKTQEFFFKRASSIMLVDTQQLLCLYIASVDVCFQVVA